MVVGTDVKAAFERWKSLLGGVEKDLQQIVDFYMAKADPDDENVHVRLARDQVADQVAAVRAVINQMGQPSTEPYYPLVKLLGIEGNDVYVPVKYWAEYLRGPDASCAFCGGDEWDDPTTPIGKYLKENKWAHSCPVCQGRAI